MYSKNFAGKIFLSVVFVTLFSGFSIGQTVEDQQKLIIRKPWHIIQDKMTGIGRHKSMNENSKITFTDSGTWICTDPIENEKEGTWSIKEPNTLYLRPGKTGTQLKCEIQILNEETLRFKFKSFSAIRILEWEIDE